MAKQPIHVIHVPTATERATTLGTEFVRQGWQDSCVLNFQQAIVPETFQHHLIHMFGHTAWLEYQKANQPLSIYQQRSHCLWLGHVKMILQAIENNQDTVWVWEDDALPNQFDPKLLTLSSQLDRVYPDWFCATLGFTESWNNLKPMSEFPKPCHPDFFASPHWWGSHAMIYNTKNPNFCRLIYDCPVKYWTRDHLSHLCYFEWDDFISKQSPGRVIATTQQWVGIQSTPSLIRDGAQASLSAEAYAYVVQQWLPLLGQGASVNL